MSEPYRDYFIGMLATRTPWGGGNWWICVWTLGLTWAHDRQQCRIHVYVRLQKIYQPRIGGHWYPIDKGCYLHVPVYKLTDLMPCPITIQYIQSCFHSPMDFLVHPESHQFNSHREARHHLPWERHDEKWSCCRCFRWLKL